MNDQHTSLSIRAVRAFSLVELIVVISIIVILLAVSVPAIRSTMASAASSAAETNLRIALLSARNAAVNADSGNDTALVFFFEPGGRTTALVCEQVATFNDNPEKSADAGRDVFVPIPRVDPVQLPEGWMIRGLVLVGQLNQTDSDGSPQDWYDDADQRGHDPSTRNWLFPETGFYDERDASDGADRQSFLIRFEGKTGAVMFGDTREALVLSPRPTVSGREELKRKLDKAYQDIRVERGGDIAKVVQRAFGIVNPNGNLSNGKSGPLELLFGDVSGDTVLCRSVSQLALYKVSDLANGLSLRLDRDTASTYKDVKKMKSPRPQLAIIPKRVAEIMSWIEGDTNWDPSKKRFGDGVLYLNNKDPAKNDHPIARIYAIDRYTAKLQSVPLLNLGEIAGGGS